MPMLCFINVAQSTYDVLCAAHEEWATCAHEKWATVGPRMESKARVCQRGVEFHV